MTTPTSRRTIRTRRTTSTFTPTTTKVVTSEAKSIAGVANAKTLKELREERRNARTGATAYRAELAQNVITETEVKGGAASVADSMKNVGTAYKWAGARFAKLAVADKVVAELVSLVPTSKSKAFFKRIPVLGTYIENREIAVVKGMLVTIAPVMLTNLADFVSSETLADVLDNTAETLIDMGARDGIKASTSFISPKLEAIWNELSGTTTDTQA